MNETNLKPCPFCGEIPQFRSGELDYGRVTVNCINRNCKVRPYIQIYQPDAEAIEAWNTRHTEYNFVIPVSIDDAYQEMRALVLDFENIMDAHGLREAAQKRLDIHETKLREISLKKSKGAKNGQ